MDLKYGTQNRNFLPSQPYYSMFPDVLESNQAEDFHDLIPQPEVCVDSLERQLINLEDTQTQFFNQYGSSTQHVEPPLCATGVANLSDTNGDKTAFRFIGPLQENDYNVWDYPDTYSLSNQMDSLGTILCGNDHSETQTLDMPIQETQNMEDILYKKNESVYNNSMLDTVTFQDNSFISSAGENFTQDIDLMKNSLEFPAFDDLNIDNPLTESLEELLFGEEHVLSLNNINDRTALFQSNSLENVNDNLGTYQNHTYNMSFPFSKPSTQNNENSFKKSNKSSLTNMENYISQTVSDLYVETQTLCQPIDNNNIPVESRTMEDLVNEAICNVGCTYSNNKNDTLQQVSNIEKEVQKPGFNKSFAQLNEDTCKDSAIYKDSMQIRNNITEVESLLSSSSEGSVDKFPKLHLPDKTNSETSCNSELSTLACRNGEITVPYDDSNSCKEKMLVNKENHYNSSADNQLSIDKYLCIKPSKEKIIKDMNNRKGTSILLNDLNRKTLTIHDETIFGHQKHNLGKMVTGTNNKKTTVQNNTWQGTVVIEQEKSQEYVHVNKRQSNSNTEDGKINLQPKLRYQTDQINVLNVNKSSGIQCEERNIKENVTTKDISNCKSSSSFDLKVQENDILQKVTPSVSPSGPSVSTVAVKQRCSQCGIFLTHSELRGHVCDNDNNNSHMCALCNEILIGDYSVFTHLLSHKEETIYECDYCGKPFCDFNSLSDHISKHANTGVYSCDFCTTKYIQNSDISTHLLTHGIEPSYKCGTCEKYFSLQSVFLEHQQIHQQLLCHICGTFIVGKRILSSHLKYHEKQTSLQHIDECVPSNASKKWNLDYNLLKQYIGFENDVETKPYLCDVCGKQFLGQSSFLRHLCTHNDVFIDTFTFSSAFDNKSRSQPYQKFFSEKLSTPANYVTVQNVNSQKINKNSCNVCNKSFKTPNSLKRHVCVYKDEKNFVCEVCDKSFSRSDQLSVHSLIHTREKRYVCHVCQKSYSQRPALTYHLKSHGTFNKFECKMCRRFFPNKIKLDYHMSSHTGKQPYKCKICGKSFAWLSSCYTHQGTHSDTNVYSCELCNKIFKTKQNLVAHMSKTYLHCSPKES